METPPQQPRPTRGAGLGRGKLWLFRLSAVLLGLSPFLIAEAALRVTGWRPQSPSVDPYVGFHAIRPLFELSADGEFYEIPKSRQEFFEPERFHARKPDNEFRIFCLGGSTVQGRPYSIKTSFTKWLELSLRAAAPERRWKVVNCGGVSYASYRLAPILEECLRHQPDFIILYTGHNEFLEDRSYKHLKSPSPLVLALHRAAAPSRVYQWAMTLRSPPAKPTVLNQEVDALLDYQGGLESYHRDPQWRVEVVRHFNSNIVRMIRLARAADTPIVLVNPVANLRDSPPFKVEPKPDLAPESRKRFDELLDKAKRRFAQRPAEAADLLDEARRLDPEHAGLWFLLGHCRLAAGDFEAAREAFLKAKDFDVCPLRMTEPLHAALRDAVKRTSAPLIDARGDFRSRAEHGLVGDDQLVDHVHPSFDGHQAIARLLYDHLFDVGVVQRSADETQEERREAYRLHWRDEIDETYIARGKQKLEGLRRWASGRAYKVRKPETSF